MRLHQKFFPTRYSRLSQDAEKSTKSDLEVMTSDEESMAPSESCSECQRLRQYIQDHIILSDQERRNLKPQWHVTWKVLAALLLVLVALSLYLFPKSMLLDLDRICNIHTSQSYAPVLKKKTIKYINDVEFDGSLEAPMNIFRQKARPEVDEAWESLGINYRPVLIPEGKPARDAGLDQGLLKRPAEEGGGHLVLVEGLHHLHCLNLLRKASYWNYDYYNAMGIHEFNNGDEFLYKHYAHCLDALRQQIMCTIDYNVYGQIWVNDTHTGTLDFTTPRHTCKDFEAVRQWAEENQVDEDELMQVHREGDIALATAS